MNINLFGKFRKKIIIGIVTAILVVLLLFQVLFSGLGKDFGVGNLNKYATTKFDFSDKEKLIGQLDALLNNSQTLGLKDYKTNEIKDLIDKLKHNPSPGKSKLSINDIQKVR